MAGYLIEYPPNVFAVHSVVQEGNALPSVTTLIRNLTATLLTHVCHVVSLEPPLQPPASKVMNYDTSNRQDEAELTLLPDISGELYRKHFSLYTKSNQKFTPTSCFSHHAKLSQIKEAIYKQRIQLRFNMGPSPFSSSVPPGA